MMNVLDFLQENIVYLDGGMGTLLQQQGLAAGEAPERWNLSHPDVITAIHRAYFDAGSHIVATNTFGANLLHFDAEELERIVAAAIANARRAAEESTAPRGKWVALDIGPCGRLLKPYGDLDFEDAVTLFAATVRFGVKYGADLILIETMNDSYETKAALLAAKENSSLPVFVSNAYGEDGKLMTGASPAAMVALLEGMGADAVGVNCSLGPEALFPVVEEYLRCASVPVLVKPNAGIPREEDGKTVFDVSAEDFAASMKNMATKGARLLGGCCGTTPAYIAALVKATACLSPVPIYDKRITAVSSYTHAVEFGPSPVLIGERINPTGKKRLRQALVEGDMDYILTEGLRQQDAGAHILDVNVGLPEIDEPVLLANAVTELQAVCDLPLQLDTSDPAAMERALRRYNGKALINSVNGKEESMRAIFPLVKKYGGVVVALTLDENGIPADAADRAAIAERIVNEAEAYGIARKNIIFDTLAMTVSADRNAANTALTALRIIRNRLGCHTSLGVSNISFGLPERETLNSTFFALALENGLSAAIINPHSESMMRTYYAYRVLHGLDENCGDYIAFAERLAPKAEVKPAVDSGEKPGLRHAIEKGLAQQAGQFAAELLQSAAPLDIVQREIIPALDAVGQRYEEKTAYLPQLLMSAEAAKAAFAEIKKAMEKEPRGSGEGLRIVLATVQGDIHDIGKNIVKLLLENYGFAVTDLGRDVPPETVAEKVKALHAPLVGLSALMTTTVPAMGETIRLLRKEAPWCKVMVGGAVLSADYAEKLGADRYAKDAMEAVRYAEELGNKGGIQQ